MVSSPHPVSGRGRAKPGVPEPGAVPGLSTCLFSGMESTKPSRVSEGCGCEHPFFSFSSVFPCPYETLSQHGPTEGVGGRLNRLKLHLCLLGVSAVFPRLLMEGLCCSFLLPFPFLHFLDNSINFLLVSIWRELCGAGNIFHCGAVKCTQFCPPGSWLQCNKYDGVLCVPLAGQPGEERTSGGAGRARTQGESLGWRLSHCTKLSPNEA